MAIRGWNKKKKIEKVTKEEIKAFKQRVERGAEDVENKKAQSAKLKAEIKALENSLKDIKGELRKRFVAYEAELVIQKEGLNKDAEKNRLKSVELKAREDKLASAEEAFKDKFTQSDSRLKERELSVSIREQTVSEDEAKIVTQGAEIREIIIKYNKGLREQSLERTRLRELEQSLEDSEASLVRLKESLDAQRANLREEAKSLIEKRDKLDKEVEAEEKLSTIIKADLGKLNKEKGAFSKDKEEVNKLKAEIDEAKKQIKTLTEALAYQEDCLHDREKLVELNKRELAKQKKIIQQLRKGGE